MDRCNVCASCVAVVEFRSQHTGRRNTKRVEKFETLNKCTNPTAQNKKRRISELDSLYSDGHGGEVRGEISAVLSLEEVSLASEARAAHPKCNLREDKAFDSNAFDNYCSLILQCTEVAKESKSSGVKAEAPSIIPKMRGLLDPAVKGEVDYAEATKDGINILAQWMIGDTAGTRAFIPDLKDRDECYAAAFQIYSCAGEEA